MEWLFTDPREFYDQDTSFDIIICNLQSGYSGVTLATVWVGNPHGIFDKSLWEIESKLTATLNYFSIQLSADDNWPPSWAWILAP
jgi:hypothetical protein